MDSLDMKLGIIDLGELVDYNEDKISFEYSGDVPDMYEKVESLCKKFLKYKKVSINISTDHATEDHFVEIKFL